MTGAPPDSSGKANAITVQGGVISPLAARMAVAAEDQLGLLDARRVASLPVERPLTPEEVEAVSAAEVAPDWFAGTACPEPFRLWRQQAQALVAFQALRGVFAPLRVGGGKTAISFLCVKHAHRQGPFGFAIKRSLLVVPSRGIRKLMDLDVPKLRRIIGFDVPVHYLAGLVPKKRLELAKSGLPGCYVSTYSLLSKPQAPAELEAIRPALWVFDEAHVLANQRTSAAMKRRVFREIEALRAMAVFLSGTMSRKTFLDAWPLVVLALRERAPVPLDRMAAELWAVVVDAAAGARIPLDHLKALEPVREWALEELRRGTIPADEAGGPLTPTPDGLCRAVRLRRNYAPGVVASADGEVGATLIFQNRPPFEEVCGPGATEADFDRKVASIEVALETKVPRPTPEDWIPDDDFRPMAPFERLVALMWAVEVRMRTPWGDEIEVALNTYQHCDELAAGFYNELTWPEPDDLAKERRISKREAEDVLARARAHRRAVSSFVGARGGMREFLSGEHVPGLDTPLLIWAGCARRDRRIPDPLYERWLKVRGAEFEGMPKRVSRTVRVCDWKIRAAVRWAREVEAEHGPDVGGIVWAWNVELLEWLREGFTAAFGPDRVLYCPAGKAADRAISDPSNRNRFAIASIAAHGEIKDLPHFEHQVFVQTPRPANVMEQTLGRTHREGQKADELPVRTLLALDWEHAKFSATLSDAMWLSRAEARQKVVYADYDPLPVLYPPRFLQERGFRLESMDQESALRAVFGEGAFREGGA